jgi:hypothetical protein
MAKRLDSTSREAFKAAICDRLFLEATKDKNTLNGFFYMKIFE